MGGYEEEEGKRAKCAGNGGRTVYLSDGSRVRQCYGTGSRPTNERGARTGPGSTLQYSNSSPFHIPPM